MEWCRRASDLPSEPGRLASLLALKVLLPSFLHLLPCPHG